MFDSTSRDSYLEIPGCPKLFTRVWGEEDPAAPAVAIIHGLGDHSGRWERVGRMFRSRGFAAYALDLPGHGRSEGRRGHVKTWDDYRDAVTRWIESVRGANDSRRWGMLGHSLGALIALDWTGQHPRLVDALVLSAPPFELSLHPSIIKVHAARIIGLLWPGFTQGNQIPPSLLSHDPAVIQAHRSDPYVHFSISARLFLEFQAMRRKLSRVAGTHSIPTLLIQGGADPVTSCLGSAEWAKAAKEGIVTFREYPGLYHEVLNEVGGDKILDEVIDWLKQKLLGPRQEPAAARSVSTASIHPR